MDREFYGENTVAIYLSVLEDMTSHEWRVKIEKDGYATIQRKDGEGWLTSIVAGNEGKNLLQALIHVVHRYSKAND